MSIFFVRSFIFSDKLSKLKSSSISSSLENFFSAKFFIQNGDSRKASLIYCSHWKQINIDGPSLDYFDTEKFVSDWIESFVTWRHLNVHDSSRTGTHEEADENVNVL